MGKTALLFVGQGSQYAGMGNDFLNNSVNGFIFDLASDIVGFDILKMCQEGELEELSKTAISQPCIMACSLAAFHDYCHINGGDSFGAVAGHSLGEYAAMVAAGVVSIEDGFRLIKARANAMQKAADENAGVMYAIIGPTAQTVEEICAKADGYAVPVNYNSPVQTVIAGETAAVEGILPHFVALKAKVIKLNVSSAFHSKLMQSAADEFYEFAAKGITYMKPRRSFFSNLMGDELKDFSDMPTLLSKHIVSPVRFTSELTNLSALGYDNFVELGPGKVLTGLVKKTIKK